MIKNIGYLIYAVFFHLFRLFPVSEKKVFLIATHDSSGEGNIGIVAKEWEKRNGGYRFIMMTKNDGISHPFHFFVTLSYHMATSAYILLDNIFLPMAYLTFSKKAKIVQLWHGTGTIKRFGQSVNTGQLKKLEYKANQKMTYLIVNSEYTKKIYKEAFQVPEKKICVLGLPRTDLLIDEEYKRKKLAAFYREYPELADKYIILYAPTFRDDEIDNPVIPLNFDRLLSVLPADTVVMLRLHPHVAAAFSDQRLAAYDGKVWNMSNYPEVSTLLFAADELITDYSSIIFEYCILERPMMFYAYDLEYFEAKGRSFYEDYRSYVPGIVVESEEQLYENLMKNREERAAIAKDFKEESFDFLDGQAARRLLDLLQIEK